MGNDRIKKETTEHAQEILLNTIFLSLSPGRYTENAKKLKGQPNIPKMNMDLEYDLPITAFATVDSMVPEIQKDQTVVDMSAHPDKLRARLQSNQNLKTWVVSPGAKRVRDEIMLRPRLRPLTRTPRP